MKRKLAMVVATVVLVLATASPAFAGNAYGYQHGKDCGSTVGHKSGLDCGLHRG